MLTLALSLAGIPLTVGFIAKFYLVAAGVTAAAWLLIWALLIGSAIGVCYYLRLVFAMTKRGELVAEPGPHPGIAWEGVAVVVALGAAVLALGIQPSPLIALLPTLPS